MKRALIYLGAIGVLVLFIAPMALVLLTSFKSEQESRVLSFDLPERFLHSNYVEVLSNPKTLTGIMNGVIITSSVTFGTILICAMAAYVIARRDTAFTRGAYSFILAGMIAPFAVIPAIKMLQLLGLYGSYAGLILTDIAVQTPFICMIFVGFIRQIPREMDEAAILDGAGVLRTFFFVILPMLKPVAATAAILLVTFAWNEFQNVLYLLPNANRWTMPMSVFDYRNQHTSNYGLVSAHLIVTIAPVVILYLAAQKYIVSGIMAGAVKS